MVIEDALFGMHHEEHTGEVEEELGAVTLAEIKASPEGFLQATLAGQPNLIGYALVSSLRGEEYIADLGWHVILHQTESEALAAVGQQTRTTLILAVIVAIIAVLVGVGMGQLMANPIARLRDTVAQFTSGNLDARVDIQSEDEIGTLATSFNQMAEQVGGLLQTVQTRSVELEERTKELEASQRVTFAASEHATPNELLDLVVNLIRD